MTLTDLRQHLCALRAWKPGKLAKDTLVMSLGIGLRTVGQAFVFIVVARMLGIEAYGAYAAVLAIAGTIGCFGGFGIQTVMLRDVSRQPDCFPLAWGRTLVVMGISSPLLMGFYFLFTWLLLPGEISWSVVIGIGVAELIFTPIAQAGINAYQGHEHLGRAAWLVFTPILSRLVGALVLLALIHIVPDTPPLELWAALYSVTAILAAIYAVYRVNRDLGQPQWPAIKNTFTGLREGMLFASSGTALKLYADIDKTMLARLAGLEAAGLYSAAYRVMDMATIPVVALLTTSLPRFFRASREHIPGTSLIPWRLLPAPICYTTAIGLFLYFTAMWLPKILGSSFEPAVSAVQWLAWLPLVSLPRLFLQTRLIAGDLQRAVVVVLSAGAVFNIILNLILIPSMNWRGAIIATYAAEVAMGMVLFQLADKKSSSWKMTAVPADDELV
jgi:O-antigen/teichoic acid export membrane protein